MKIFLLASYAPSLINFRGPLIRTLVAEGHEVIAAAPEKDDEVERSLREMGVRYMSVPLRRTGLNPLEDLLLLGWLIRLLLELKPDVALAYTAKPVIYGLIAARLARVPFRHAIITGLGYCFENDSRKQRIIGKVVRVLYRLSLSGCKRVFFQNPDDRRLFVDAGLIAREKTVVVNGSGVDLEHYSPAPSVSNPLSFLLIARLLGDKGIVEYVEAAKALKRQYPKVTFNLLGPIDPNPAAIPVEQIHAWQQEGAIKYLGETRDVRPFLAQTSVYVLPSYHEGTPRTVLEAMAMGRPVITTDAPGCRETVTDGENGFLVPVKDPQALTEAMKKFLVTPQLIEEMGSASMRIAQAKYDVRKVNSVIMANLELEQVVPDEAVPEPVATTRVEA